MSFFGRSVSQQKNKYYVRKAHHAGSWYEDDEAQLSNTLNRFLLEASSSSSLGDDDRLEGIARGIVSPHAGFSYSGPTAAYAYLALREMLVTKKQEPITIVVLHPSHHVYLDGCAVSNASLIETPILSLPVDDDLRNELLTSSSLFSVMSKQTDEEEHSGEMQYPFVAKSILDAQHQNCRILPIMVGSVSTKKEKEYGYNLAPIIHRPNIFTVVSTDFCHWGQRFGYTSHDNDIPIYESIERMDRLGMDHIEMQKPGAFATYLKATANTICGRHPLAVWLHAIYCNKESNQETLAVKFVKYAQSSQVQSLRESSVSYASAVARKVN